MEAFGTIREETGTVINHYKFTSREYDDDSGLYYYRARYYDAGISRFLSKDSLIFNDNLYAYVENNPIKYTDPSGHVIVTGLLVALVLTGITFEVNYCMNNPIDPSNPGDLVDIWVEGGKGIAVATAGYVSGGLSQMLGGGTAAVGMTASFCSQVAENIVSGKENIWEGTPESTAAGTVGAFIEIKAVGRLPSKVSSMLYPTGKNAQRIWAQEIIKHGVEKIIVEGFNYYTRYDWSYWYSDDLYYSYSGTDVTSIEDWHHFFILVDPEKVEYKPGETAQVTILVLNKNEQETIWLGVSFKDPTGKSAEYDPQITITPQSATINQNEIKTFTAEWTVPDDAPLGTYRIAVNAWKDGTFTEKYTDNLEWRKIFKVVPVEDFSRGYADNDFYYLTSYSAPGTINVYDRDTLELHTTISLPYPRFMDSHGDLFVCTFKEACYPDGPTYSYSGIAVYDKSDNFNCLKKTDLRWDVYHDYSTRQPMIDDNSLILALANSDEIAVYDSAPPFNHITSVNIPGGDLNDAAHDSKYVGIATAWSDYHQYVYEKGTWNLTADIVGPYNGNGMAFYHGDHDYLFISYTYKQGRAAEYIKYDYHDLNGPYVKKVVTPEFEVIADIIACPPYILISGWNIGETEQLLQVRNAETDEVVANFEPTFDGWIQWLDYYLEYLSPLTITAKCPVDLIVTDPDGLTIDKQSTEIPGATYIVTDLNGDGDLNDRIIIPDRKKGDYQITVIPEIDAAPTDTYTLEVSTWDATIVLAENVSVSEIPADPYIFESTAVANFTFTPENPVVNQTITFNATSSTGNITSYEWNFSDGNITTSPYPVITHSYTEAGAYTATLTVTDNDGLTSTTSRTVTVIGILGDLDGDDILTPTDAAIVLQIAVGSRQCNATTLAAADMNGDGRITSLDALMILQAVV